MSPTEDQGQQAARRGGCYCGAVSYTVTGKPVLSAYCHCTICQRLNGCPFVHTLHFSPSALQWTHIGGNTALDMYRVKDKPAKQRFRCKTCGSCIASYHSERQSWSILGAQLERIPEDFKPTAHIFYGTRLLDVNDGLDKWEGYQGKSRRL
ncbi:hypothetical protein Moror_7238 [Moniliophthora roreri MCA 2997]|uniref:CENP-V/GFA domain-containing protein n=1 Tax=Moniliophthora roreri (strain MCA 2997) TaxID=1381753 RepID=V2XAP1_MONRO|nr:hypothetical protein Moror_7238 [Moniliophthora roreri MCA 2997]